MEAFPMSSGYGPQSYAKNSSYQGMGVIISLAMAREAINKADSLYTEELLRQWGTFRVADLGCSSGPNTFRVADELVEAMGLKYEAHRLAQPDFQFFFNDHATNDFNTLFTTLPAGNGRRRYFPAGVPGTFHGRLFPKASLHLVYSSYSLHWLSQVPEAVRDRRSPAWNKGRIHLAGAPEMTLRAYEDQYQVDMKSFLGARADEVVAGGCMALAIACVGVGVAKGESPMATLFHLVSSTLMEMSAEGLVEEAKVDSINVPFYLPWVEELKRSVKENQCFSIVDVRQLFGSTGHVKLTAGDVNMHIRAILETVLRDHMEAEMIDQLFDRTLIKLQKIMSAFLSDLVPEDYIVLLRRNPK